MNGAEDDRQRILLVEDDPASADLLRFELDDAAPGRYDLTVAGNLDHARVEVERTRFDAVLLDLGLPDARGLDGVRTLLEADPSLPVVVLTGQHDGAVADEALREGAQDYLVKGRVDAAAVARSIRYATGRKLAALALERRSRELERINAFGEALMACDDHEAVAAAVADLLPDLLRRPVRLRVAASASAPPGAEADDVPGASRRVATTAGGGSEIELRPGALLMLGPSDAADDDDAVRRVLGPVVRLLTMQVATLDLRTQLFDRSVRDPLTGLFNRRYLYETAERELSRALRAGQPIGVLFLDLDRFKGINDRYGHATGDVALRVVASFLRGAVRNEDVAARYGGEEFVVLLPGASLEVTAQRGRQIVAALRTEGAARLAELSGAASPPDGLRLTASVGVAAYPHHGVDADGLIGHADAACYRAKERGRDRVEVAESA